MLKFYSILFILSTLACYQLAAQWQVNGSSIYNTNSGNVGIGIVDPSEKLVVDGNVKINQNSGKLYWNWPHRAIEQYSLDEGTSFMIRFKNSMGSGQGNPYGGFDFTDYLGTSVLRINNFNVGIGISMPSEKLQVGGNLFLNQQNPTLYWSGNSLNLTSKDNCIPVVCLRGTASYNPRLDMYKAVTGERTIVLDAGSDCFFNSGKVGIGTTNPQNLLDVKGTIHAQEVKVDMNNWSDFVFHPSYQLKPLTEVEKFIKANGHLQDIPSAKEVEQNGVNVGEMQKKLLQKVEELTLYVIEKDKQLAEQQKVNAAQEKINKEQQQMLLQMKEKLDEFEKK